MSSAILDAFQQASIFAKETNKHFYKLQKHSSVHQTDLNMFEIKLKQLGSMLMKAEEHVVQLSHENAEQKKQLWSKDQELETFYQSMPILQAKLAFTEKDLSDANAERLSFSEKLGQAHAFNGVLSLENANLKNEHIGLRTRIEELEMQLGSSPRVPTETQQPKGSKVTIRSPSPELNGYNSHSPLGKTFANAVQNNGSSPTNDRNTRKNLTNGTVTEEGSGKTSQKKGRGNIKGLNPNAAFVPSAAQDKSRDTEISVTSETVNGEVSPMESSPPKTNTKTPKMAPHLHAPNSEAQKPTFSEGREDIFLPKAKGEVTPIKMTRSRTPPHLRAPKATTKKENIKNEAESPLKETMKSVPTYAEVASSLPVDQDTSHEASSATKATNRNVNSTNLPKHSDLDLPATTKKLPIESKKPQQNRSMSGLTPTVIAALNYTPPWQRDTKKEKPIESAQTDVATKPDTVERKKFVPPHLRVLKTPKQQTPTGAVALPRLETISMSKDQAAQANNIDESKPDLPPIAANALETKKQNQIKFPEHSKSDSITNQRLDELDVAKNDDTAGTNANKRPSEDLIDLWDPGHAAAAEASQKEPSSPDLSSRKDKTENSSVSESISNKSSTKFAFKFPKKTSHPVTVSSAFEDLSSLNQEESRASPPPSPVKNLNLWPEASSPVTKNHDYSSWQKPNLSTTAFMNAISKASDFAENYKATLRTTPPILDDDFFDPEEEYQPPKIIGTHVLGELLDDNEKKYVLKPGNTWVETNWSWKTLGLQWKAVTQDGKFAYRL